ncbi:GAF domain-containing protein, partial [Candidatus Omnitrophota bacterium]
MSLFNNILEHTAWSETFLYVFGPSSVIASVILYVALIVKSKRVKKLQNSLRNLQKTYDDLDNQAKLIIKTDLELHKTQGELDKKVTGLYTLQKISRTLSTTLDENEVFEKISEEYLTELGFDRALSFLIDPGSFKSLNANSVDIKLNIGYDEKEIQKIFNNTFANEVIGRVIEKAEIISHLDYKIDRRKIEPLTKVLQINSFVCAPITMKEGVIGALFVGSESAYSPLTIGDKEIVSILATQIGQSLENAGLFEEAWRSQQELEVKVRRRTQELSEALEARID